MIFRSSLVVGIPPIVLFVAGLGCAPAPLMVPTAKLKERDMEHALVTFVRSGVMSPTQKAEVWDRKTPVGELSARSFIQYKAAPGRHLFMAKAEQSDKWSYVEANLITGEHYVILVDVIPGGYAARFKMTPTSPKNGKPTRADIDEWLGKLKGKTLIKEMIPSYTENRIRQVEIAIKSYENGKMVPEILYPENFWPKSP